MNRLVVTFMVLSSATAFADNAAKAPVVTGPDRRAKAVRRTSTVVVDGRLDEAAWKDAPRQNSFTQRFPTYGGKASLDTSFAVLYDDSAVYVGVWANDPEPAKIRRTLHRRDLDALADVIAVGFDSYRDKRTAFVFQLNAAGVQRDMMVFDDVNIDDTWDAVWTGNVSVNGEGWSAEFRIPLNQLRYSAASSHEWGLQVVRNVARSNEQSSWSPWPRTGSEVASKFGIIAGIDGLKPSRRLELLPYASGGIQSTPVDEGDPLDDGFGGVANAGLDLKYGLGSAFTLSATINPDFGQVEADPSAVNLSANELFFAERRPFFLEGADLFRIPMDVNNGNETAFYTRRIGAAPSVEPPDYEYLQQPSATTIYSAAKVTGKSRGWSVGVLDAVTAEETATIIDADGNRQQPIVAPLTNYAVARVKRDWREGRTTVGLSGTAVNRALAGTGLESSFHDQAYTLGATLSHRWAKNAWQLDMSWLGSLVHGTEEAIAATQLSQRHLFQRPDTFRFDPTRTNLIGGAASWSFGQTGTTKHWRYGSAGGITTPGLELNDAGFQRNSDLLISSFYGQYHDETPGEDILNWQTSVNFFWVQTAEPRLTDLGVEGNTNVQLANMWNVSAGYGIYDNIWSRGELRGGPSLRVNPRYSANLFVTSDTTKRVWANVGLFGSRDWTSDSGDVGVQGGLTIQARSNIDLFLGPSWSRRDEAMQYVEETADEMGRPHYVFARIDQSTVAMTIRVNWTFSPKLSLQAYAQPFVANGQYRDFKDVNDSGAARFEDRFDQLPRNLALMDGVYTASNNGTFSFGRPDFNFAQIRSNVVMRWEYRPGSSVFAIWSHGQTAFGEDGRFRLGRDLGDLGSAPAEDIVMVKANYWIGL
jgi:hypothetical protein